MATTLLSPGPQYNILQNVIYALPGSPCNVVLGSACERSALIGGPFVGWTGGYNHVGGFIRCTTGGTTYKATKLKMKELDTLYSPVIMNDRPSNYWPFDEASGTVVVDVVGGLNGTLTGGVTLNQAGAVGKSVLFDGVDDGIESPSTAFLRVPCSVEFLVKISNPTSTSFVTFPWIGLGNTSFEIKTLNNALRLIQLSPDQLSQDNVYGTKNISDGNWHHAVVVWKGGTLIDFYVDGLLDPHTGSLSATPLPSINKLWQFGRSSWSGTFQGCTLDEVAIYPYALSPSQIQSHYLARFGLTNPSSYQAKVVLSGASNYWPLNETSGTSARDVVGGADGTISAGALLNQTGVVGKSMTFDPSCGIVTSVVNVPLVCSVEGWIKPTAATTYHSMFSTRYAPNGFLVGIDSSRKVTCYGDASTPTVVATPIAVNLNEWHHIVFIRTATTTTLYVNTVPYTFAQTHFALSITVAISDPGNGNAFTGSLDEIAVYPRALTPAEILSHYQSR